MILLRALRDFASSLVEDLVGMALVVLAILGIAAFLEWMPDDAPVLAGAGIIAIFALLTIVALRWARRASGSNGA